MFIIYAFLFGEFWIMGMYYLYKKEIESNETVSSKNKKEGLQKFLHIGII